MVDNKDEYQLPEEEKSKEYTPQAYQHSTENVMSMLKNKRVQMGLAGAIGLAIIMYVLSTLSKPPANNDTDTPDPNPSSGQQDEKKDTSKKDDSKPSTPEDERIKQIEQDIKAQAEATTSLKSQVKKLSDDIKNQDFSDIKEEMSELKSSIDEIKDQLKPKPPPKPEPKPKLQSFHLRAAQDGRAWIQNDQTGKTESVAVGDTIPTYGDVLVIDPEKGVLTTSSGRLIEFNHEAN